MVEVKLKHEKPNNPIIGSKTQSLREIKINGQSFTYNKIYKVKKEFYNKHSNIFKPINNN